MAEGAALALVGIVAFIAGLVMGVRATGGSGGSPA